MFRYCTVTLFYSVFVARYVHYYSNNSKGMHYYMHTCTLINVTSTYLTIYTVRTP